MVLADGSVKNIVVNRVCIVGPGGSGKSQLAFKAIHQYEKEEIFDLVVPVYFSDVSYMSFSDFLSNICFSIKQSFGFVFLNPISYCCMTSFNKFGWCFGGISQRKTTAKVKM